MIDGQFESLLSRGHRVEVDDVTTTIVDLGEGAERHRLGEEGRLPDQSPFTPVAFLEAGADLVFQDEPVRPGTSITSAQAMLWRLYTRGVLAACWRPSPSWCR